MCVNALGAALKHVGDKVFISDSGMRRTVPKVLVVVTDGRSQDDVKKSAAKLQHAGITNLNDHPWPAFLNATYNCLFVGETRPGQVLDGFDRRCVFLKPQCCVFHRLQCVCGGCRRRRHCRTEEHRKQAKRETRLHRR